MNKNILFWKKVSCLAYLTNINLYFKFKHFENSNVSNFDTLKLLKNHLEPFCSGNPKRDLKVVQIQAIEFFEINVGKSRIRHKTT